MADWSELPIDILGLVMQRFDLVEDYHRFRAVCKSWRSLTGKKPNFSLKIPSLVIVTEKNQDEEKGNLLFWSQSNSQSFELNLPETACSRVTGVYPGWILIVDGHDFKIYLLNLLTRKKISFPPMSHIRYQYSKKLIPAILIDIFITKVVASTSPEQGDCILLAIYEKFDMWAFARIGDRDWTYISVPRHFEDAVYYKGNFYVVDRHGVVFVCDLHCRTTTAVLTPPAFVLVRFDHRYLVESCGDLYLLCRERRPYFQTVDRFATSGFCVFRLVRDDDNGNFCIEDVHDLGDRAFFIGYNPSTSISSSDCVRANCIYFCDDMWVPYYYNGGLHDMGIFDMKTNKVEEDQYGSQFQIQFGTRLNLFFWFFN